MRDKALDMSVLSVLPLVSMMDISKQEFDFVSSHVLKLVPMSASTKPSCLEDEKF